MKVETPIISEIKLDSNAFWNNKHFLFFDIDWACDGVLEDRTNIVEPFSAKATYFITNETPLMKKSKSNNNFELGIRTKFNFLLKGSFQPSSNHICSIRMRLI